MRSYGRVKLADAAGALAEGDKAQLVLLDCSAASILSIPARPIDLAVYEPSPALMGQLVS